MAYDLFEIWFRCQSCVYLNFTTFTNVSAVVKDACVTFRLLHLASEAALLRTVRSGECTPGFAPGCGPPCSSILRRTMLAMSTATVVTVELLDILFWQVFGALVLVPASVPWTLSGFTAEGDRQDTEP